MERGDDPGDRWDALSHAFPDLAFLVDEDGLFVDVIAGEHSESLLYDDPSVLVGETLHAVFPDERAEEFLSIVHRAIETDQLQIHEYPLEVREGERWFEARVAALPFGSDGNDAVVWVTRDITERMRYEKRLAETAEQLEALNRVVRHDIRNDMSVILGWAQLLEAHVDEDGREYLENVLASGEHIVELTEIARDYVEALTSAAEIEVVPTPLRTTLLTEIDLRRESFPNAEFVIRGEVPDVEVEANEMLGSVFRNILNNAVQHNDKDEPVVEVSCEVDDGDVVVRVADNGPGIPDDRKDSVFGKGGKGPESLGTGIGLYLVRSLLTQYDGEVRVADNEPEGAIFTVRLPEAG